MKRIPTVALTLITMMFIVAFTVPAMANGYASCGNVHTTDLIAGGGGKSHTGTVVGTVTVSNNETDVCVDINLTEAGWSLTETHIEVAKTLAAIPLNNKGTSAVPGQFENEQSFDIFDGATSATYCVPFYDIEGKETYGGYVVAAHAVVTHEVCNADNTACETEEESAWADGTEFSQYKGWDTYISGLYVQSCEELMYCPCYTQAQIHNAGDQHTTDVFFDSDNTEMIAIKYYAYPENTDTEFYGERAPYTQDDSLTCFGPNDMDFPTLTLEEAEGCYQMLYDDGNPFFPTVVSAGQVWMDRNLGADQVATSSDDSEAYGDLYQWGRGTDGHESRTSLTTSVLSSDDEPGHGKFITVSEMPKDWKTPQNDMLWQGTAGGNNPCPPGFRLPTEAELETERLSWDTNDEAGAFGSPTKLVAAGYRIDNNGTIFSASGNYWSSTVVDFGRHSYSRGLSFAGQVPAEFKSYSHADGFSVRCLQD